LKLRVKLPIYKPDSKATDNVQDHTGSVRGLKVGRMWGLRNARRGTALCLGPGRSHCLLNATACAQQYLLNPKRFKAFKTLLRRPSWLKDLDRNAINGVRISTTRSRSAALILYRFRRNLLICMCVRCALACNTRCHTL